MRFTEVLREAGRNLATGTARAIALALLVAVVAGGLAVLDTQSMSEVIRTAELYRQRGASIVILKAEGGVDGGACEALATLPGIRTAGAISTQETPVTLSALPTSPLTAFVASPGFATMLPQSTGQREAGLILPEAVAASLGLTMGETIHTAEGETRLGGTYTYPDDGRPAGMGYAAISLAPANRRFDECWIDGYPLDRATLDLLHTAIAADVSPSDSEVHVGQHNSTLGVATVPQDDFTSRDSARAPVVGMVIAVGLAALATWTRRLELAAALHIGVTKADQVAILLLEAMVWAGIGAGAAVAPVVILTRDLPGADRPAVITSALLTPLLVVAGSLLGVLLAALTIRESKLFSWFKAR